MGEFIRPLCKIMAIKNYKVISSFQGINGEHLEEGAFVEMEEKLARRFINMGRIKDALPEDGNEESVDISEMNKAQLVEFAKVNFGLEFKPNASRGQMIAEIEVASENQAAAQNPSI